MNSFILDIGKTNLKCQLLDHTGACLWSTTSANISISPEQGSSTPYTHFDIKSIWQWLLDSLKKASEKHNIDAINVSTHGACAVLLKEDGELALPVLDYEDTAVEEISAEYNEVRPTFKDTLSPSLPAGLNVGRQLWWLRKKFPKEYGQTKTLLFYPQYWAWRLCGVFASERTSLGCHTDMWQPNEDCYSSIVNDLQLSHVIPPLVDNRHSLGVVSPEIVELTGINAKCKVFPGVHDSNASLACHLWHTSKSLQIDTDVTVVSSGTWIITMAMGTPMNKLLEEKDMLANVNILGQPVACGRFMGGREFEIICDSTNAELSNNASRQDIQHLIDDEIYALPNFAGNSGPYCSRQAEISTVENYDKEYNGKALAILYTALMIDLELDLLGSKGSVLFGSTSLKNPLICQLIAQLREKQEIFLSQEEAGTVKGCWALINWGQPQAEDIKPACKQVYTRATSAEIARLKDYKKSWRLKLGH